MNQQPGAGEEDVFKPIPRYIHEFAASQPSRVALVDETGGIDYGALGSLMNRIAAALQRDGIRKGGAIAVCAANSVDYAALYFGALQAGVVVVPLSQSVSGESLCAMIADCGARVLFLDAAGAAAMGDEEQASSIRRIALDGSAGGEPFLSWLAARGLLPQPVAIRPEDPCNIIYSSGTTGSPKGIVQSHGMKAGSVTRGHANGYGPDAVCLLSTPLYSNTTLGGLIPAIGCGGAAVLMRKFDTTAWLAAAQRHRATHTMLVPVQVQRLLAHEAFDRHDLSSFRRVFCLGAPFGRAQKEEVLRRWPGELVEIYGMTEGGAICVLHARQNPGKLHTVGRPPPGNEFRVIDEEGRELPPGSVGELAGASAGMMNGYHGQPEKTREIEWHDAAGKKFLRMGDIGRFDEDGFLILLDRKKDLIISGGFNIYPADLETQLLADPEVLEAAVIGVPSQQWGETPLALVVLAPGSMASADDIMNRANERLGKMQRLSRVRVVAELPRNPMGKVLRKELRERYALDTLA